MIEFRELLDFREEGAEGRWVGFLSYIPVDLQEKGRRENQFRLKYETIEGGTYVRKTQFDPEPPCQ